MASATSTRSNWKAFREARADRVPDALRAERDLHRGARRSRRRVHAGRPRVLFLRANADHDLASDYGDPRLASREGTLAEARSRVVFGNRFRYESRDLARWQAPHLRLDAYSPRFRSLDRGARR